MSLQYYSPIRSSDWLWRNATTRWVVQLARQISDTQQVLCSGSILIIRTWAQYWAYICLAVVSLESDIGGTFSHKQYVNMTIGMNPFSWFLASLFPITENKVIRPTVVIKRVLFVANLYSVCACVYSLAMNWMLKRTHVRWRWKSWD